MEALKNKLTVTAYSKALLSLTGIYFATYFLRYRFISQIEMVLCVVFSALTFLATFALLKNKKAAMCKKSVFISILPFFAILFTISLVLAAYMAVWTHILVSSSVLINSIVLFFAFEQNNKVKIWLGIIYTCGMMLVGLIFLARLFVSLFGSITTAKTELSPNSVYLAEVIVYDEGALGGSTVVEVRRLDRDINLAIAKLEKAPTQVYVGGWGEFMSMRLYWKNDEVLYINGEYKYMK